MEKFSPEADLVVIGGGAAGFFTAVNAAAMAPGLRVVILEKSQKLLSKVLVSGGGRCNVTHACFDNKELAANYPRGEKELRQAFSKFSAGDTVNWFESRGVKLKTEDDGRMFPVSDNSEDIADCLLREAEKHNVEVICGMEITGLERVGDGWQLQFQGNYPSMTTRNVMIASGGGRNTEAYKWIIETGHSVVTPVPSLFTFNIKDSSLTELMGVSVADAIVTLPGTGTKTRGPVLITHWGLSGPAVLKASASAARNLAECQYKFEVNISWIGITNEEQVYERLKKLRTDSPAVQCTRSVFESLPSRLWLYLTGKAGISSDSRWADVSNTALRKLSAVLAADKYKAEGKTTFKEEFVTCGGVVRSEINFSTMESKIAPGLYFAGEIIDIDGFTGGFNFQNAWTTGYIAACDIAAGYVNSH